MTKINKEEYQILKGLDDKWKWIARIEDRRLYAFKKKPVKKDGHSSYWRVSDGRYEEPCSVLGLFDKIHLFQFIQWEDREPYNIAELIEEYEFENVLRDDDPEKGQLYPNLEITEGHGMSESEWTEFIARYRYKWHLKQEGYIVIEKPTIPKFVAEYLDERKEYPIYKLIDSDFIYDIHDELARWLYYNDKKTSKERELSLVLAHIYGYEVEEDTKYIIDTDDIEISDGNHYLTNLMLSKDRVELPIVGDKFYAIQFDDINQAQAIASYVGGRVEEVEE